MVAVLLLLVAFRCRRLRAHLVMDRFRGSRGYGRIPCSGVYRLLLRLDWGVAFRFLLEKYHNIIIRVEHRGWLDLYS